MGPLCAMPPLLLLLLLELLQEAGQGPPEPPTRRDWAQPWGALSPVGGRVWSQITVPQPLGADTGVEGLKQARCWGALGGLEEGGDREKGWGGTDVVAAVTSPQQGCQHRDGGPYSVLPLWCPQQASLGSCCFQLPVPNSPLLCFSACARMQCPTC